MIRRARVAEACLALLVVTLLLLRAVILPWPRLGPGWSDFAAYHGAAAQLLAGRSPYAESTYIYPPLTAVLCLPLAVLPYVSARLAWFGLSLGALAAAVLLLARTVRLERSPLLGVAAVVAALGTLSENLVLGQLQPLLLLLLVGAQAAARRRRELLEGTLLGLAIGLKLWPALLVLGPLAARRLRTVASAVMVSLLLVVGGAVAVSLLPGRPLPPATDFLFGTPSVFNASLGGAAMRLLHQPHRGDRVPREWYIVGGQLESLRLGLAERAVGLTATVVTVALGLLALWWAGLLAAGAEREGPRAAALLTLALLAAPVSWYHYQLLQVLGLVLLLEWLWPRHRVAAATACGLILAGSWSVGTAVAGYVTTFGWGPGRPLLLLAAATVPPASGIGLLVLIVLLARRERLSCGP